VAVKKFNGGRFRVAFGHSFLFGEGIKRLRAKVRVKVRRESGCRR
jgi:hypothetical protein